MKKTLITLALAAILSLGASAADKTPAQRNAEAQKAETQQVSKDAKGGDCRKYDNSATRKECDRKNGKGDCCKKGDATKADCCKKGDAKKGDCKKGDCKKGDAMKNDCKKGDAKKGDFKKKAPEKE